MSSRLFFVLALCLLAPAALADGDKKPGSGSAANETNNAHGNGSDGNGSVTPAGEGSDAGDTSAPASHGPDANKKQP